MMKKDKTLRIALSSVLMLAIVAAGVTMYHSESSTREQQEEMAEEQPNSEKTQLAKGQEEAMNSGAGEDGQTEAEQPETTDVTSGDAQAENTQALGKNTDSQKKPDGTASPEATQTPSASPDAQNTEENNAESATTPESTESSATGNESTADTSAVVSPALNFSDDSTMLWPVSGEVLIDYSMDATIYFPTLDQYKYNSALVLKSAVGEPVQAAANGKVVSVTENEETGTTVTMDLGNGYQAVYGQLKDLTVGEGQIVEAGTILGYINDPTKYYVKEGANLYFSMTKDGAAIDPMIYIETVTE